MTATRISPRPQKSSGRPHEVCLRGIRHACALKKGSVEAENTTEATELLRIKGLFVTTIAEKGAKETEKKSKRGSSKVSTKTIAMFARELAVLVSTGTPIVDAIASLERQAKDEEWIKVLGDIQRHLEEGDSLHAALQSHPAVFDAVFRSLVAAGESSGHLDTMLNRLAILTRRQTQIHANISGAMIYPILLTGISLVVLGVMIGVVLPRFSALFETLDTPLPTTTKFLMWLSDLMRGYWWAIIPAFVGGIVVLVSWLRKEAGMNAIGTLILKTPKVREIFMSFYTAHITRLLGVLLEAHVPMLESIHLTRQSINHRAYQKLLDDAEQAVTNGEPISLCLIVETSSCRLCAKHCATASSPVVSRMFSTTSRIILMRRTRPSSNPFRASSNPSS